MQLIPNLLIIPVGLIIGVLVAAPVGPVNVLCVQRAIERGFWGGIAAGLGSVLGDGLIALCAASKRWRLACVGAVLGADQSMRQRSGGAAVEGSRLSLRGRLLVRRLVRKEIRQIELHRPHVREAEQRRNVLLWNAPARAAGLARALPV